MNGLSRIPPLLVAKNLQLISRRFVMLFSIYSISLWLLHYSRYLSSQYVVVVHVHCIVICQVDPSLIGGMVVTVGDKYIDMSMASKIKTYTNLISQAA